MPVACIGNKVHLDVSGLLPDCRGHTVLSILRCHLRVGPEDMRTGELAPPLSWAKQETWPCGKGIGELVGLTTQLPFRPTSRVLIWLTPTSTTSMN